MITVDCPAHECSGEVEVEVSCEPRSAYPPAKSMTIDVRATHYRTIGEHNHPAMEADL